MCEFKIRNLEEHHKAFAKRIEQLEMEREVLVQKHKKDRKQLEIEIDEKTGIIRQLENEFRELAQSKVSSKMQIDEYELKIKSLIHELEDESKKHISEVQQIHDHYRAQQQANFHAEQKMREMEGQVQHVAQREAEAVREIERLAE